MVGFLSTTFTDVTALWVKLRKKSLNSDHKSLVTYECFIRDSKGVPGGVQLPSVLSEKQKKCGGYEANFAERISYHGNGPDMFIVFHA